MKKYVYSKGAELVTVETDGLGTINNFMVTGVIGENYGGLVHSGLAFKMGDEVNIAEMLNAAKRCECKVECYEGNKLIVNESVDFTSGEPAFVGEVSGLSLGVAYDEATYNAAVPASYRETYDYEASKEALPWLVAIFNRTGDAETSMSVQVFADETPLEIRNVPESVGTVNPENPTVLTTKAKSYLMFDIVKDLGILEPEKVTWFTVQCLYGGRIYAAKQYVTPGTI